MLLYHYNKNNHINNTKAETLASTALLLPEDDCFLLPASCLHLLVFNLGDAAITSLPQHSTQKIAPMDEVDIPPPGGDQNRGPVVIAILSLFFGLSTIIVFLRVVTRIWITRNFGWDDATMALTQVRSVPTWTKNC